MDAAEIRQAGGDEGLWSWLARDCIAHQAARQPDRTACVVLTTGERYSFRQLEETVAAAAAHLARRAASGARVVLLARNSLHHLVLLFACARAGLVFVPLNWRLPAAELKLLLKDAQPELMFVDPEFAEAGGEAAADLPVETVSTLGLAWPAVEAEPVPLQPLASDAPWVLLYTSGTTGRPKGVVITRRTAFFGAYNFAQVSGVSAASATLADAPFFHVVGLMAVLHAGVAAGACVLIADRFTPAATLARLSDPAYGVTHYFCVPQMAQALLDDPGYASADLSRLHGFFTGGAPLPAPLAQALIEDRIPLSNGYGLSEAGTVMHMPLRDARTTAKPTAVGAPAPCVEVRLVGTDGRDVATGEIGEVWLRGPAVTPGYWRQPEATAAAFSDGWYRTGDAGRRDEDGFYTLIDRWKDMYISGGENVYPAEVESALMELEGVADAAVVGVSHARWGETGCAFLVRASGADGLDEAAVNAFCRKRLAGYKRPTAVRFIDSIPRTASGKIRKDLLRANANALPQP